jgi:DNA-binding response OmpR family regulator
MQLTNLRVNPQQQCWRSPTIALILVVAWKRYSNEDELSSATLLLSPGMRILIVDDNKDAVASLSHLFELEGHEVASAERADDALGFMAELFDLIIIDAKTPLLRSWDVPAKFRRHGNRAVIACTSGFDQPQNNESSMQSGCDFHLGKPVDFHQLAEVLLVAQRRANARNTQAIKVS